jgi:hypothetical protein
MNLVKMSVLVVILALQPASGGDGALGLGAWVDRMTGGYGSGRSSHRDAFDVSGAAVGPETGHRGTARRTRVFTVQEPEGSLQRYRDFDCPDGRPLCAR